MNKKLIEVATLQKKLAFENKTVNIKHIKENLNKLYRMIKDNEQEIVNALRKDLNKDEYQTLVGEIFIIYHELKMYIKKLKKFHKTTKVKNTLSTFGSKSYVVNKPYGTVLIIGPFNYPVQLSLLPLVGALASGNKAIVLFSTRVKNISQFLIDLINKTFDKKVVFADWSSRENLSHIIEKKLTDLVFFTGSVAAGGSIGANCAKVHIPYILELGGKSPCVVSKNANVKKAAKLVAWGKFFNGGQTCIAPDYVLIDESIKKEFINELEIQTNLMWSKENTTHIVNLEYVNHLKEMIQGEKVLFGNVIEGRYVSPTALDIKDYKTSKIMQDEIFGPILPIITYKKYDQIFEIIKMNPFPLASYIFSKNKKEVQDFITKIDAGGTTINGMLSHFVNGNLPFGGIKESGVGSYHGKKSFEAFSLQQSVLKSRTPAFKFQFPNYKNKAKGIKIIRKLHSD